MSSLWDLGFVAASGCFLLGGMLESRIEAHTRVKVSGLMSQMNPFLLTFKKGPYFGRVQNPKLIEF